MRPLLAVCYAAGTLLDGQVTRGRPEAPRLSDQRAGRWVALESRCLGVQPGLCAAQRHLGCGSGRSCPKAVGFSSSWF